MHKVVVFPNVLCRAPANDCDLPESCGRAPDCPADAIKANGTTCTDHNRDTTEDVCTNGVCNGIVRIGDETYTIGLCGDEWCDATESATSCPEDCFASCAGSASFCSRGYDEVVVAGTHNANVSTGYPDYIALVGFNSNQDRTLTTQLDHGIRHLDLDMDYCVPGATSGVS